ncbi:MAG: hypothetical protein LBB36_01535, partial [Fibromonadaceae bacterium]|nr:hypothetical protein [Fibromonadaceae bacterium]
MKTGRFLLGSISFALVFIFSCDSGGGSGGGDSYPKDVWCVYGLVPLSDCTALPIPNAETESQYKTNCETTNGTFFTSQPTECSGQGGGGGSSSSVVGGSSSSGGGVSSPSGDGYPKDLWCIFEISEEDCEPYDIIDAEDEADLKEFCEENGGMFSASKPSICGSLGGVSSSSARGVSSSGGGGSYPKDL